MPVNKVSQIIIPLSTAAAWTGTTEFVFDGVDLDFLSDGNDTTASQSTVAVYEGVVTNLKITSSGASFASGYIALQLGGGPEVRVSGNLTNAIIPVVCGNSPASGLEITSVGTTIGDVIKFTLIEGYIQQFTPSTNIAELLISGTDGVTPAVRGEYVQSGTLNGQPAYLFGTAYNLSWDNSTDWQIRAGSTPGAGDLEFSRTDASQLGDYTAEAGSTGTVTVNYGPTDHDASTGSPGMEADGVAGFIDLKTSYDFLNGLRAGKFGIVSALNMNSDNAVNDKLLSAETGNSVGYSLKILDSGLDSLRMFWSGTAPSTTTMDAANETLHNYTNTFDIANTNGYTAIDGDNLKTDSSSDGLDACMSTLLRLGSLASTLSNPIKAKFGFTAILGLTAVTTVDATWSTGLSEAINTAAIASNYNPHSIAAAIFAYDANITGVYWALDELSAGDASSYYLLAYDITDGSAKTSEFYGLVSTSGVTGTSLVSADGGGGRRGRYTGGGRYAGFRRSRYN